MEVYNRNKVGRSGMEWWRWGRVRTVSLAEATKLVTSAAEAHSSGVHHARWSHVQLLFWCPAQCSSCQNNSYMKEGNIWVELIFQMFTACVCEIKAGKKNNNNNTAKDLWVGGGRDEVGEGERGFKPAMEEQDLNEGRKRKDITKGRWKRNWKGN